MKEHHRTDRLTVMAIFLFALIAIGLITYNKPKFVYKISTKEALKEVEKAEFSVSIKEAKELLTKKAGNVRFVDVRDRGNYVIRHIEGAINIPMMKLLEKENIKLFKDQKGTTFILYGDDQLAADGAWILLRQIGFNNFKVLLGGYKNYLADGKKFPDFYATYSDLEKPITDFSAEVKKATDSIRVLDGASAALSGNKTKVKKKKKAVIKKATAAAEEEGC